MPSNTLLPGAASLHNNSNEEQIEGKENEEDIDKENETILENYKTIDWYKMTRNTLFHCIRIHK